MEEKKFVVEPGSTPAPAPYRIVIDAQGPYLVYGAPPLRQYFLTPDRDGEIWSFRPGKSYSTEKEPTALCRCGRSKNKPYCDGSHLEAYWDPSLQASEEPLLNGAEITEGPEVSLADNRTFCAFARFCDAKGQVWNLVEQEGEEAAQLTLREADHCPAGRLLAWDNPLQPHEPHFEPSLGLLEDPQRHCSGPLWVRGGIPVQRPDGFTYEIRNRVTLCRCGQSSNKPFCDGTHAVLRFQDQLPRNTATIEGEW
ncbi:MAG: CDGSH iron-sulfur domain-containing protein [Alistipes sp.]|nr:CDGSH iron-sulfur domain-containing protein [Alistipes sp.]